MSSHLVLEIESYKNVGRARLTFAPVTLLLGPPGAGKSNILEAAALLGLASKLAQYTKAQDSFEEALKSMLENEAGFQDITRANDILDVFPFFEPPSQGATKVSLTIGNTSVKFELRPVSVDKDTLVLSYLATGSKGALELYVTKKDDILEISYYIGDYLDKKRSWTSVIEMDDFKQLFNIFIRLYSFERYQLSAAEILQCPDTCPSPEHTAAKHVLGEKARNMPIVASKSPLVLREVNEWLRSELESSLEVKVLARRHEVVMFSGDVEVPPGLVSDSIVRLLYYTLALYSNARALSLTRRPFIVLLEEPEARAFPYGFSLLASAISKLVKRGGYVVLTTHNPMLASVLLDKFSENKLRLYYVYTGSRGYAEVVGLNLRRMAEELVSPADIMVMPPREVVMKYAEGAGSG